MKLTTLLATFVSLATAAPPSAPLSPRQQIGNTLYPAGTYRYWVQSGDIKWDPQDQLLIVKNGNPADESTTIVTFNFPEDSAGKTCELTFELWDRDHSTGTRTLDVFTYSDPEDLDAVLQGGAGGDAARGAAAIQSRDNHVGRIVAPKPGNATWIMQYHGWPTIPCPAGELIGVEYVGAGDRVEVRWDIGVTGPRFKILDEE